MNDGTGPEHAQAPLTLYGTCPYCLQPLDVHFDIKGRPYWRCWRCEVRVFGTRTALRALSAEGWIWSGDRPVAAVRAWLHRIACGLSADITPVGESASSSSESSS